MGLENYTVRLNEETGEVLMELEENTDTDTVVSNIEQQENLKSKIVKQMKFY